MKIKLLATAFSISLYSCSSQLPIAYSQKTLKEKSYVENKRKEYFVHPNSSYTIEIQNLKIDTIAFKKKNENIWVFRSYPARPIFRLIGKDTVLLANRKLDFKNTVNFRDIGGLKTIDGKTVKWGKIFRSDNLSKLKKNEFEKFEALQIATVIDLRTPAEIAPKKDHLPENIIYKAMPIVNDQGDLLAQMKGKVIRGEISEEESRQLMRELYEKCVSENIPALREVILKIVESEQPILYHCSAGKDRTGIVTALLLSILNVDRKTIVDEYLLSNYYRKEKVESMLQKIKIAKIIKPKLQSNVVQNFMSVDVAYINAAFDLIDKNYGNMDNFIEKGLKIDVNLRNTIVSKLTY